MNKLENIKPGAVLTLKTHMSGYYQVKIKSVSAIRSGKYASTMSITVDAWRYYKDDPWTAALFTVDISSSDSITIEE